ncbi:hypothetical protein [Candidatus Viridilinea mediisalina]|uniref:PPM-type phosphatase domain-containing protein n=1 Tax=Candidatus Viridilinea mediisalina TaxID=2024553 RepID=A0A2A6RLY8_9CHLR|nr:hypothetical protein [Candidatus Viridilinea mediisalina]PDW03911.1 hypothetical protein CJ255_06030 [Candidatus Viridilinea mediisalina]
MQRVETLTAQLALVEGTYEEQSDLIKLVEADALDATMRRKGQLYLLVEAHHTGPQALAACHIVRRVIFQGFYSDSSYSVTSSLRAAIRLANKALYEHNFKLPDEQRVFVGLSCAILRDTDLFLAQVPPTQAYLLAEGRLRALPTHPSWDPAHVSIAPFVRSGALGASLFIEPELYRCSMNSGAGMLLCTSSFAPLLGRIELDHALRQGDPAVVMERLRQAATAHELGEAHALSMTVTAVRKQALRLPRGAGRATSEPAERAGWLQRLGSAVLRVVRPQLDEPQPEPTAPDSLRQLPPQPTLSPKPIPRPPPIDLGPGIDEHYAQMRRKDYDTAPVRHENLPPSAFLGEDLAPGALKQPIDLGDPIALTPGRPYRPRYEYKPLIDMTWGERLSLPFRRTVLGIEERWRARRVRNSLPPQSPMLRGQGLTYRRLRAPIPWQLLLGLVVTVIVLIFYGIMLTQANEQQLAIEYFEVAEQRLAQVREAPNDAEAMESLELASQAIDEVRSSPTVNDTNPALWLRYQDLQREYERALAAVQRLNFLDNPVVLATHPLETGQFIDLVVPPQLVGVTDTLVIENMNHIYAVDADTRNGRLYRIPREGGQAQPYLTPGQGVGTAVVGSVRAALWRIDQVIAIDQAPNGFGYYFQSGGNWNYSKLGASEIWFPRDRLDVEEYMGNLYIWGAQPNEVLRFRSGFYGDPPDYWLDPASIAGIDLSTVVDMAVDGSIYLLRSNGTILIFSQGQLVAEVTPEALNPPINLVRGFSVTGVGPDDGYFFLVDTLNGRIIQVEKTSGRVIQQVKTRPNSSVHFDALTSLVVDTSNPRPILYVVNGNQIIRAELPDLPRPFRENDEG